MSLVVESIRTAPPQRQLMLALAGGAVILALLVAVYFLVLRKPYEVLFSDLRPMDAATIVGELDKKKIPYRLDDGGATIRVPKDQVASTRLAVMSGDLPLKGMVGFELFNKSDMGLTEFAQKINYQRALQGELARTIMTMDAVDTARVHLSLAEPTIFRADRLPSKASVTIVTRPGKILTPGAVRGIQRLVAAAVPELDLANVVVLDRRGEVLSGEVLPTALAAPLVQTREAIEEYYAGRVRMALQRVYPASAAEVSVSAPALALEQPVAGHAPALESWTPATRDFGLHVSVSTATALAPAGQAEFRYLVGEAIGFNPALGDTVSFVLAPAVTTAPRPSAAPPAWDTQAQARRLSGGGLSTFNLLVVAALPILILLFAAAFWLERRRSTPRRLTVRQRARYAEKLRMLLDKETVDAGV